MAIKIYVDEDVHAFLAEALRLRGWDAVTTPGAGRCGAEDEDQVRFAAAHSHAILTYNVRDYTRLHYELLAAGEAHAGIIVATQEDPRENLRALFALLTTFSEDDVRNQLIFLSNWFTN